MRLRIIPLTLVGLLTATGCVSVSGSGAPEPPAPAPSLAPAGDPSPSPVRPGQPSARQELARTGPDKPKEEKETEKEKRKEKGREKDPDAHEPPRRTVRPDSPARRAPAEVRPPKKDRPRVGVRPSRPRTDYDMGSLCDDSAGVTDPSLTALCRQNYGR
ncbi:hypothetical protein [Streptomyces sp. NPDC000410]|uniref:hypothetical protein n=1 Tax=Streptomyces sp. NPDC000410 TaxID=3154254 RepID=UPI00333024BD